MYFNNDLDFKVYDPGTNHVRETLSVEYWEDQHAELDWCVSGLTVDDSRAVYRDRALCDDIENAILLEVRN